MEKEELIRRVWPDAFVEEGNLAVQISLLRKTFGQESYIETVPRRGYRFVAPVHVAFPAEAAATAVTQAASPAASKGGNGGGGSRRQWLLGGRRPVWQPYRNSTI